MSLEDVILPKAYKNSKVLFEQNLDKWRLKAQDAFANVNFNLTQIAKDTFLPGYEYDNDGNPNYTIPLEARINQFLGGAAVITGTASPTWTVNTLGNSATETTAILTAPRTYQWPDVSGTYFLNFATQPGNIIGVNQITANGGSPFLFNLVGGAHTNLTAGAEASDFIMNWARTVTFATGAITNQRAFRILAPTYAFNGASTITNAATVYIGGSPIAGANATLTNSWSLWVDSGDVKIDDNLVLGGNVVSDGNIVWKSGTAFTGTLDHANTANRIWTLPDIAGAILIDAGVQAITGAKTFASNTFLLGGAGAGIATIIYANTATSRAYTVPDAGAAANFVMTEGAQTLNGPKTLVSPKINTSIDMSAGVVAVSLAADVGAVNFGANTLVLDGLNGKVAIGTVPSSTINPGGLLVISEIASNGADDVPNNIGTGYLNALNAVFCIGAGAAAGGGLIGTRDFNCSTFVRNAVGDYTITFNTANSASELCASACPLNAAIGSNIQNCIIVNSTANIVDVGIIDDAGIAIDSDYSISVIGT